MVGLSVSTGIFIVITLFSSACFSEQSADKTSWQVQLKTSGGFTGRGNGNVVITSEGQITYEKPPLPDRQHSPCRRTISGEELRTLNSAVAQTKPKGWQIAGLEFAAPDAYGYDLELRRGEVEHHVKWYDNTREKLPEDLKKLFEAVSRAKENAAKRCEG